MTKKITFLGIETSCDETAAAVIRENDNGTADILSNIVSSQIEEHKKFGGVVPELAARAHLENIEYIIDTALNDSKFAIEEIDGVAATAGPGLIVCLTVGLNIGKSIAAFSNKPFVGVNHLEGHALSPGLQEKIEFPYLLLLISGGHTQYLIVKDVNEYEQLGTTIDDALGEAFDKTAKMLDLGYPGGPDVEKFAKLGNKDSVKLPEPIINRAGCNLSFAGLKTAVLRESKKINGEDKLRYNLAASFQNTINKILYKKTKVAVDMFRKKIKKENFQLIVAGGVAANESIRNNLSSLSKEMNFKTVYPDLKFCGDNAAMIAWAGIQRFKKNLIDDVNISAKSRWPLDKDAPYMKGPGLKL
ncbi:tRNA (adenosine(37)-N6)-threonylcarbamoyltransferase complex transferase subunit TsaD [Pelagibacteraceae bacterium]|nr:tRNA (adenosine(37)-N6)-threonylcarbamoyltransferase complex transferase subunit TsaD [Pelagibacteraceae bacterium]MDC0858515.1 tRNA (adenosine(37)-N6)-threonylcarbamoyltransferase complex transferase subunit TsaD [Pelagibacteraceae bacterium]